MIRLIVEVIDANDAVHINAPVRKTFHTFDVEHNELEVLLAGNPNCFITGTLVGAEIIKDDDGGEDIGYIQNVRAGLESSKKEG